MLRTPDFPLKRLTSLIALIVAGAAQAEDYYFDPALFQGSAYGQNIGQFNQQHISPGNYLADVYVNNTLVKTGVKVTFADKGPDSAPEPCLTASLMKSAQLKAVSEADEPTT